LIFAVARDITDQRTVNETIQKLNEDLIRRTNQLETSNKELESFSYSVSHDLRAPLRSMDGFSQALLEDYSDRLDNQGRDYLQRVRSASQRMAQLIDDLLLLSRITRTDMRQEEVNLSDLAAEAAQNLSQAAPHRQIDFLIQPELRANGDTRLLRQVFDNLLNNSCKFTEKHSTAKIEFGLAPNGGKPAYYIRDDGAGFDMAYSNKLFGAFQRLHSFEDFKGTGIGLATVQRIIQRHGGRIWAESVVEKGATFYFTLS
jgi:light-regulated signal transduction histidine kinase (bacteriophytochrome)